MANRFSLLESGGPPTTKEHGRIAYSLTMARGFGEWCIDLSFMQSHRETIAKRDAALQACVEALEAATSQTIGHDEYFQMVDAAIQQAKEAQK